LKRAFENIYVIDQTTLLEDFDLVKEVIEKRIGSGEIHVLKQVIEKFEKGVREGDPQAMRGLENIERLRELISGREDLELRIVNIQEKITPEKTLEQVIRDYTLEIGGILITSDPLQKRISQAINIEVIEVSKKKSGLLFEKYFDAETMSIHLKAGAPPRAKKGSPLKWFFEYLDNKPLTEKDLEDIINDILEEIKIRRRGFIEIERPYSIIAQIDIYRIVIVKPPLSDTSEVTITRPIASPSLESYNLRQDLVKRLLEKAEGILIAGAPGMGKTTFAQALAKFYMEKGKIVKTVESPRDMHLPDEISQYSKSKGTSEELHDILLLSRPDYTVFDEMRDDADFNLYVDLRLAGIGMIGVVHATSPIDAVQRFLRRVDLGMIPSIVDTVIFINKGRIEKIYELELTVKLPTGLREIELARPVVEVRDLETGELEYEIYTFGEQTVIVPVKRLGSLDVRDRKIYQEIKKQFPEADIEREGEVVWIKIPRNRIGGVGKNFLRLKKKLEKKYNIVLRIKLGEETT